MTEGERTDERPSTAVIRIVRERFGIELQDAIETPDGPVMVFPFVEGTHPDESRALAGDAAELLAQMHRGIGEAWKDRGKVSVRRPPSAELDPLDPRLQDEQLDAWEQTGTPGRLPIHGDYYGGNLLIADGRIAGVLDWAEARLEHHAQEVSWAAWEFCQNSSGDDLIDDEAARFLRRYKDADGPAPVSPPFDPTPWIRQRLRREASRWFRDPASVLNASDYHEAQVRAFTVLRGRTLNR